MQTVRIAVAGADWEHLGLSPSPPWNVPDTTSCASAAHSAWTCTTGDGLDAALTGVEAVIDATSYTGADRDDAVVYFGTTTRNLLAAEERAGVRHHVLLSIVGVHRIEGTRTTPASASRSAL